MFFEAVMGIDYTEVTGLDDLHHPQGVIQEAQALAADCFGAEETMFLVGGSTAGNLAMITAVCGRGDLLLVQRNVHKSVIHGLMLAGAQAVFLSPRWDGDHGIASGVGPDELERALRQHPHAKGVFLTNPNYYGMTVDLKLLAEIVHRYGKILLVDEAHGAHFGLHPDLPPSALACGADAVVQSTHKMLTAMTMGAMLHVQGGRINRPLLKQRLAMLQSSSPSYPIMASLDLSRRLLHTSGYKLLKRGLDRVAGFSRKLQEFPCFDMIKGASGSYDYLDPFKITLYDTTETFTGFQLQEQLERRGIMTEMADPFHVLLQCSFATTREDLDRLLHALADIRHTFGLGAGNPVGLKARYARMPIPEQTEDPVTFDLQSSPGAVKSVPTEQAAGYSAAEAVIPYPPGIPVLYKGERITEEIRDFILTLADAGARFQGMESGRVIAVYDEAGTP